MEAIGFQYLLGILAGFYQNTSDATKPNSWIVVEGFEIIGAESGIYTDNGNNIIIWRQHYRPLGHFSECHSTDPTICNKDHGVYFTGTYVNVLNNF